jgi:hypothetical protein
MKISHFGQKTELREILLALLAASIISFGLKMSWTPSIFQMDLHLKVVPSLLV